MASSKDVVKGLNIIGAGFLSSSDKKTFDDLIHEYFDPRSKCDIMNLLHNNEYNMQFLKTIMILVIPMNLMIVKRSSQQKVIHSIKIHNSVINNNLC